MAQWADLEIVDEDFPLAVGIKPGWGESTSEKRAEGGDAADLEERGNQKLLVRCLIVMEACSIMKTL